MSTTFIEGTIPILTAEEEHQLEAESDPSCPPPVLEKMVFDLDDLERQKLTLVPVPEAVKSKKRKKNKGRNGNIYIGVANRIEWLKLQKQYGFENINNFGNFVMGYLTKVHEDFELLHQVAIQAKIFDDQGLSGFQWINGLPHPVDASGNFIALPQIELTEEKSKVIFELAYDLAVKRGVFLLDLARKLSQPPSGPADSLPVSSDNITNEDYKGPGSSNDVEEDQQDDVGEDMRVEDQQDDVDDDMRVEDLQDDVDEDMGIEDPQDDDRDEMKIEDQQDEDFEEKLVHKSNATLELENTDVEYFFEDSGVSL